LNFPVLSDPFFKSFDEALSELRVPAYLCGGTVRDLLLKRPFRDVDVVLPERVFAVAQLFRSKMNAPYFVLDKERQVARVVCGGGNWDFSGFRDETIEGDLRKRDFTINAMAVLWENFYPGQSLQQLIDPYSGKKDLEQKIIRVVAPESLVEDPLRMLRAFRIQAELHFKMAPDVLAQIEQIHAMIDDVAAERITEELDRIFLLTDSAKTWQALGKSSLFGSIFPEMKPMQGCEQGGFHHLDVWEHTVDSLVYLEDLFLRIDEFFPEHASFLREYLESSSGALNRKQLLKWALLLHDIGKPATRELKEPGRWRFHGHDHIGADIVDKLLQRLKFSRKDTQFISSLVEHHLRPLNLFNLEDRDYYRFFRAAGQEAIGIILMAYGDMSAARGPLADPSRMDEYRSLMADLFRFYREEYYPAVNTPELIKGRDLMVLFQMKPGPMMGQLLKDLREAQLSGQLRSREQAVDFASRWLKDKT
jgi:poly(A) polymerase